MGPTAPDICQTLNLVANGCPRCRSFSGAIPDYIDHVRNRLPEKMERDFNELLAEEYLPGIAVARLLIFGTWTAHVLRRFAWSKVEEALDAAHAERLTRKSRGAARGKVMPTDFRTALKNLELHQATAASNLPQRISRPEPGLEMQPNRPNFTEVSFELNIPMPVDGTGKPAVDHDSDHDQPHRRHQAIQRQTGSAHISKAPSVVLIPDSPGSTEQHSDEAESEEGSPRPRPPTKRARTAANDRTAGVPRALDTALEGLVLGQLLGPDFLFQALASICECAGNVEAVRPKQSLACTPARGTATRLVPIQQGEDHWILCQIRRGYPIMLYDPQGSRESVAGIENARAMISDKGMIARSSPLFQVQAGDSEVLLLYTALCLVGKSSIPAAVNTPFCRHLLCCVFSPPSPMSAEQQGDQNRFSHIPMMVQRMLDPFLDVSTWGQPRVRLSDALERVLKAKKDMQSQRELIMVSAHHGAELFHKLNESAAHGTPPLGNGQFRIEAGLEFCTSVRDEIARTTSHDGSPA
ncbi:hypothetical protein Purlil1_12715 [Purpureocillium lilacinum]|uniref:Ubiquitin-like protease family profile domain-containing protein n=1 Tax=Purpureocillium lilacinum TaxID=33203 RepID=A0ABR0BG24_PURLI|nr:hypothetical protein Purlil1_12715 [Purpureocillium lilacinum]